MSELTHITVKMDKKMKELFLELCKREGVDISQAVRELIAEAIDRDYIIKQRKERLQKIRTNTNSA
jgi:antitoxin component of RelBE/YafQ-DinJ toxin-antitoxin module